MQSSYVDRIFDALTNINKEDAVQASFFALKEPPKAEGDLCNIEDCFPILSALFVALKNLD